MREPERRTRVLHAFSNFVPAGPEMRAVRLIAAFGPRAHHLVLSMDGRTSAAALLPPGIEVSLLPSPPRAGTPATVRRLRRLLASTRPDLVLTYNWGAFDMLVAAAIAGLRAVVHHEDGFNADEAERLFVRRVLARRLLLPRLRRVVVPSRGLESIALRRWRVPRARLALVRNGVEVADHAVADHNLPLRRAHGIPAHACLVGAVAHLREEKALHRLMAALRALPAAHLVLVGDGPERVALAEAAASPALAGRVHLVGHQADPRPWLRALDVFALSSQTEQLPVALLEAMATALPVVATAVGDVPEALPPEQRELLAEPGGAVVAGLTERLARLLGDAELRRRLGGLNRARVVREFDFAATRSAFARIYRQALPARAADDWPSAEVA